MRSQVVVVVAVVIVFAYDSTIGVIHMVEWVFIDILAAHASCRAADWPCRVVLSCCVPVNTLRGLVAVDR